MAETKNLMIVSISAEPKMTQSQKPFWIATDSEDTEWLCWNQEIADAVRERKLKETDYYINVSEKGDKTYRSIQGIPGVIEPQKRSGGGGGRQFIPRDPQAEEQAKWPSFALSYAKDVHIAQGDFTPGRITKTATEFMEWLNKYRQAPKVEPKSEGSAQRVQESGGIRPEQRDPATSGATAVDSLGDTHGGTPTPVNAELAQRPLKIKLIGEIKRLDPAERHTTHEQLYEMPFEMLEQIKRELNAERLAS